MRHAALSLILALSLALTGQAMAVARGEAAAVGQMVLCTGTGQVMVHVDAQGRPTGPPVICPDAALAMLTDAGAAASLPLWRAWVPLAHGAPRTVTRHGRRPDAVRARGPPRVV